MPTWLLRHLGCTHWAVHIVSTQKNVLCVPVIPCERRECACKCASVRACACMCACTRVHACDRARADREEGTRRGARPARGLVFAARSTAAAPICPQQQTLSMGHMPRAGGTCHVQGERSQSWHVKGPGQVSSRLVAAPLRTRR
uniref:Uncharacterized protein n=1 Tax=Chrysotila carterae TaxID=13221 RepID=A0A7S4BGC2_CHRCT